MTDRVAVITGAASGIGRATAKRLVADGLSVCLIDRVPPDLTVRQIQAEGHQARGLILDVCDQAAMATGFQEISDHYGRLDVLVCAAGINIRRDVTEMTLEEWNDVVAVNLKGAFLCCREAIRQMRTTGGGSIVTVASELGLVAARRAAAYSASKGGMIALTRGIALDHANDGIRANCVCPGPVDTPLLRGGYASESALQDALARAAGQTILGRLGRPEEIANVIAFVASAEASFMTGAVIPVDGGVTAV